MSQESLQISNSFLGRDKVEFLSLKWNAKGIHAKSAICLRKNLEDMTPEVQC